jgi:hypothetical protein
MSHIRKYLVLVLPILMAVAIDIAVTSWMHTNETQIAPSFTRGDDILDLQMKEID